MKTLLLVVAAVATLGIATPAAAQGVGVEIGPFSAGVGPDYWGPRRHYRYHDYGYGYAGDCRQIRERIVTPSGRVIFRSREVCD